MEPFVKMAGCLRIISLFERDAAHDLAERDDAEIDMNRINTPEPSHGLRRPAPGSRDDVGVDEIHGYHQTSML